MSNIETMPERPNDSIFEITQSIGSDSLLPEIKHLIPQETPQSQDEKPDFKYKIMADPKLRLDYVMLTSQLVDRVLKEKVKTVFFLDKSARPVSWMMKEMWPILAGSYIQEGSEISEVPQIPKIKFLNIDRETWRDITGSSEDDHGGLLRFDSREAKLAVKDLRAAFASSPSEVDTPDNVTKTLLDSQNIMVVDEVRVSGDTLNIAEGFIKEAFPSSHVFSEHWMRPKIVTQKGGIRLNADLPVWYKAASELGRGIGDLSTTENEQSSHARIRRGRKFFSRPLRKQDDSSLQLRKEMKHLMPEITDGELPLRLNLSGVNQATQDTRRELMERVNSMPLEVLVQKVLGSVAVKTNPHNLSTVFKQHKTKN